MPKGSGLTPRKSVATSSELWKHLGDDPIEWPADVEPWQQDQAKAERVFQEVLLGRPRSRWTGTDVHLAAIYARTLVEHEYTHLMVQKEGHLTQNSKGDWVRSPWLSLHINLQSLLIAQAKQLGIVARPGNNKPADDERASAEAATKKINENAVRHDLLA
ncbi:hypothetical protein [Ruegeria sp. HKCCD7221]|uniref:hypothetical protein n=1 Tax=Ruegeria sp. HKCCD7221 TaxID=2683009 RepID=UPI001480C9C8|nr:hypothetical protein [Ruegeria sp. HKCCD7221]